MNSVYDKALAQNQAAQQRQQLGEARAEQAQVPGQQLGVVGYSDLPHDGASPGDVVDYMAKRFGQLLPELYALRIRVWQLEQVNATHLQARDEMRLALLRARQDVVTLENHIKSQAPEKKILVVGCFGLGARVERPMEVLSCGSANGETQIRVDARVKRRKRVVPVPSVD
jgi:hypothetical protein